MRVAILFLTALMVSVGPSSAQEKLSVGNGFFVACGPSSQLCANYSSGIIDGLIFGEARLPAAQKNFCIPEGVTYGQLVIVATTFMAKHPEVLHLATASLFHRSFVAAFPCGK